MTGTDDDPKPSSSGLIGGADDGGVNNNNNGNVDNNHKRIFFGIPVVGFFRNAQRTRAPAQKQHQPPQPSRTSQNVNNFLLEEEDEQEEENEIRDDSHYASTTSDDDDDDDDDDFFDEELASVSKLGIRASLSSQPPNYGSLSSRNSQKRRRSGRGLWKNVHQHVMKQEFHIRDNVRDASIFQSERGGRRTKGSARTVEDVSLRNMDLPYDFTLWDCLLALLFYLAISVVAFSFVFEHWSITDSMYFAVVTFTTIGYGDLTPSTTGGRLFCIVYAAGGVAVLAIALGVIGHKIVESQVSAIGAAELQLAKEMTEDFSRRLTLSVPHHLGYHHDDDDIAKSKSDDSAASDFSNNSSNFSYLRECDQLGYSVRLRAKDIQRPWHGAADWCQSFGRMLATYLPALSPLFVGAFLIGHYEGWNWADVVYYCVITTTSIGYGDMTPDSEMMRLFAVLYVPLAVGCMGHFLGTVATFIVEQRTKAANKALWRHELTLDDLDAMSSSSGTVSELDFVVFMLKTMKKVDDDLIAAIRHHFASLDVTNSGTLDRRDLELQAHAKLREVKSKLRLGAYKQALVGKYRGDDSNISPSVSSSSSASKDDDLLQSPTKQIEDLDV